MRCFGRCKHTNVIYSLLFWLFIVVIICITLNNVEKRKGKVTPRPEVLADPLIPDQIRQPAESRVEVVPAAEAAQTGRKAAEPPPSSSCLPLRFIPDAETRPVTALVSFPGSGNTWLRHLIQESTGILTGSQFIDNTLMGRGFPGEPVFNASVAVVKTHQWGPKIRMRFQKAVLLVRHPMPAIQALFNLYSQGHTGCAEKSNYERGHGSYWQRFFRSNIRTWQLTVCDWIQNFNGPLHIVLYDQLLDDLGPTLRSLVQFLDLPVDEAALQCTVQHSEGLYHRHPCPDSFDPFTDGMKNQIVEVEHLVFKELDEFLKKK